MKEVCAPRVSDLPASRERWYGMEGMVEFHQGAEQLVNCPDIPLNPCIDGIQTGNTAGLIVAKDHALPVFIHRRLAGRQADQQDTEELGTVEAHADGQS